MSALTKTLDFNSALELHSKYFSELIYLMYLFVGAVVILSISTVYTNMYHMKISKLNRRREKKRRVNSQPIFDQQLNLYQQPMMRQQFREPPPNLETSDSDDPNAN